jgi:hypothetical protein
MYAGDCGCFVFEKDGGDVKIAHVCRIHTDASELQEAMRKLSDDMMKLLDMKVVWDKEET